MRSTVLQGFFGLAAFFGSSAALAQATCVNITPAEIQPVGGNAHIVRAR